MTASDKITIIGIVINATLFIVSMVWAWFLNKKSIQAKLDNANPAPKPKKKRRLTKVERRLLRNFRGVEIFTIIIGLSEPVNYLLFNPFPPKSILDWISLILSAAVMVGFAITVILLERDEIKQIKSGAFVRNLRRRLKESSQ